MSIFNNDNYEDDYNFIQGDKLTKEEQQKINKIISFDYKNKMSYEIYNIIHYDEKLFTEHDLIKFHILKIENIKKKNRNYLKFNGEEKLYINSYSSYIVQKQQLFLYFKKLLTLLKNHIDQDVKDYLNIKFFSNINKCKYFDCVRWFTCLFIYWFKLIINNYYCSNVTNYKDFRKEVLKNFAHENPYELCKEILQEFNNISHDFQHYEYLKIFINFALFKILDGFYILP